MPTHDNPLTLALRLIEQGRYKEARQLLERMPHNASAARWLDYIESIAPAKSHATRHEIKRATDEFEIQQIRQEIGGTSERLSLLNSAIHEAERHERPSEMLLAVGIATAPLLGFGLLIIAYALHQPRRYRAQLESLRRKRQHLLDDIEHKYRMLAHAKAR